MRSIDGGSGWMGGPRQAGWGARGSSAGGLPCTGSAFDRSPWYGQQLGKGTACGSEALGGDYKPTPGWLAYPPFGSPPYQLPSRLRIDLFQP